MTDEEILPVIRSYVASRGDKADGWFITLLRLLDAKAFTLDVTQESLDSACVERDLARASCADCEEECRELRAQVAALRTIGTATGELPMTDFNMPPGCRVSDIPGNTPSDLAAEAEMDALCELLGKFITDEEQLVAASEAVFAHVGEVYAQAYRQGQSDEGMARECNEEPVSVS